MKRLLLTVAAASTLVAGCGATTLDSGSDASAGGDTPPAAVSSTPLSAPADPAGAACAPVVSEMSVRDQLAQLLVVGVDPTDPAATTALVRNQHVGGIFIGGNATTLFTGDTLTALQQVSPVPVAIAVDDEGGRVQRIDDLVGSLPSAREMAQTMTPQQVRDVAEQRGKALRQYGVTVDYAPDLDLTDGPAGGVIGDRSWSSDPAVAKEYAVAFAQGLEAAGVQPVLKHFPGHGRASGDSHKGLVQTPPLDNLRTHDLKPYEGIADYGDDVGVMVGHLDVPGLTNGEPASLSPAAYTLLRKDYGFNGPILTDDLGAMRAISDRYPLPEAVLLALQAGADQPLWSSGGDVGPVLDRLEQAVNSGELSMDRVHEALDRVLAAKGACG